MASGTTIVGAVQYDASIDLPSLRKSIREADRLVEQSYKKQAASAKKASQATSVTGEGGTAADAEARIASIRKEAEETARSIEQYTPRVQRQFLAVERANTRVEAAQRRTNDMIQKYGEDSRQAQNASTSLTNALYSQTQAQENLSRSLSSGAATKFSQELEGSLTKVRNVALGAADRHPLAPRA
jgi:hypothetical protein